MAESERSSARHNAVVEYIESGAIVATDRFYAPGLDPDSWLARKQKRQGIWRGPHLAYGCGRVLALTVVFLMGVVCFSPAHAGTRRTTLVIDGQNGTVINGLKISTTAGPCIVVSNSTNITIQGSQIGPCGTNNSADDSQGIYVVNSSVNIYDNYIHVENQASSATLCGDSHDNIFVFNNGILPVNIQGNVLAYGQRNIRLYAFDSAVATATSNVNTIGNFLLNPRGNPSCSGVDLNNSYGTQFQSWNDSPGGMNAGILVRSNYAKCSQDTVTYKFASHCSDIYNFGYNASPVAKHNYTFGGDYGAACGVIADAGTTNADFEFNTIGDTFNCGVGLGGGSNHLVNANKILILTLSGSSSVGISVIGGTSPGPTVTNNIAGAYAGAGPDSATPSYGCYNNGSAAAPVGITAPPVDGGICTDSGGGNILDNGCIGTDCVSDAMLYPITATNPPPLIPPLPFSCVAISPYSTQTSTIRCTNPL
jgi:hypothetical protein